MAELIKELAIANIARVEIVTEETVPATYVLTDVASEAEATAYLSEGEEQILRVKDRIKAQNKTEDIVMGYDLRLLSATMVPDILALVDGGEISEDGKKYDAAVLGDTVERTSFTTNIYTEEKDADGSTISYVKFSYKNCKGTPVNYLINDGEFFAPELNIKSRSKLGDSPVSIEFMDELPA